MVDKLYRLAEAFFLLLLIVVSLFFVIVLLAIVEHYYQGHDIIDFNLANWVTAVGTLALAGLAFRALYSWQHQEVNIQRVKILKKIIKLTKNAKYNCIRIRSPIGALPNDPSKIPNSITEKDTILSELKERRNQSGKLIKRVLKLEFKFKTIYPNADSKPFANIRVFYLGILSGTHFLIEYLEGRAIDDEGYTHWYEMLFVKNMLLPWKESNLCGKFSHSKEIDDDIKSLEEFAAPLLRKFHQI